MLRAEFMIDKPRSVCILDYGSGNTKSVYNMLCTLEPDTKISNNPDDIENATHLVLPGVGAFGAAMMKIRQKLPLDVIEHQIFKKKKPFLGVCVGMQVLADTGYEFGEEQGLGWISGEVHKLEAGNQPLPHVGWNNVRTLAASPLTQDFKEDIDFYFVHSYAFRPKNSEHTIATAEYGECFASVIGRDNIYGVQFHPEKSQRAGSLLMNNFLKLTS